MKYVVVPFIALLALASGAYAETSSNIWQEPVLDSCLTTDNVSSIGTSWTPSLDHERGGSSSIEWYSSEGTFGVTGTIEPVPGSMGPGTAGMILPLGPEGEEFDINEWDGIRISIKRSGAPLLLRIHSSEILNGDYFAESIPESDDFQEYSFSFAEMSQVMSLPRPWSGKEVTAVELSSFGWSTEEFSWELAELAFYKDEAQD